MRIYNLKSTNNQILIIQKFSGKVFEILLFKNIWLLSLLDQRIFRSESSQTLYVAEHFFKLLKGAVNKIILEEFYFWVKERLQQWRLRPLLWYTRTRRWLSPSSSLIFLYNFLLYVFFWYHVGFQTMAITLNKKQNCIL